MSVLTTPNLRFTEACLQIADNLGPRSWKYQASEITPSSGFLVLIRLCQLVEALDGMNRKFANPYIIFYPVISRDGMPFPINKCIREIQDRAFREDLAWRGNIIIAKYRDNPFSSMIDASMADFPILKNYLMTHGSPGQVRS